MSLLSQLLGRLNAIQSSRGFKIAASVAVVLLGIALFGAVTLAVTGPKSNETMFAVMNDIVANAGSGVEWMGEGPLAAAKQLWNQMLVTANDGGGGLTTVGIGIFAVVGVSIMVIWLDLGLTYLGLLLLANVIAWPLMMSSAGGARGLGQLIFGFVPLALSFLILMQALRLAMSGTNPILAVARNVLNEAVRMKISLVFIVILLLLMAVVPGLLNEDQPLRYRVQQWLQYGIGLSYAVLALLTLFLAAGSVAYEQRDRIIWQTMSKPVAPWKYVLGKWVGVMGLNAVLLTVTATGVYLFTEYLRHLPAHGEMAYMVMESGQPGVTEDREILERQVLVARVGAQPMRHLDARRAAGWSDEDLRAFLDAQTEDRLQKLRSSDPSFEGTAAEVADVRAAALLEWNQQYLTIEPGTAEIYVFELPEVKREIDRVFEQLEAELESVVAEAETGSVNLDDT